MTRHVMYVFVGALQEADQDILNLIPSEVSCHEISLENTSCAWL